MNSRPRAAISWSGGKDSCYAFELAKDEYEIVAGLTMVDESGVRSRSHGIRVDLLRQQATTVGISHLTRGCDWQSYERCFIDGLRALKAEHQVSHVIFGDIVYVEHRQWAERFAAAAGLKAVEPLWGTPTVGVVQGFLEIGGRALIVAVNAMHLDSSWLGIELSTSSVAELIKRGVDPCGENGEYHTFVTYSPSFKEPLQIATGEIVNVRGCWAIDLQHVGRGATEEQGTGHGPVSVDSYACVLPERKVTLYSGGERQGNCRAHQDAAAPALFAEGSGLSTTVATGVQFRILLDQRPGVRRRARS